MTADRQAREAHLEVVRDYCSAWQAGAIGKLSDFYDDQIILHYAGNNPLSGTHIGKAAVLKALNEVGRRTNRKLMSIVDFMAGPDRAAVITREQFQKGNSRAELERVLVYRIINGKLAECWVYDSDQALVDRFLADG